jgi:hypothetical protein
MISTQNHGIHSSVSALFTLVTLKTTGIDMHNLNLPIIDLLSTFLFVCARKHRGREGRGEKGGGGGGEGGGGGGEGGEFTT